MRREVLDWGLLSACAVLSGSGPAQAAALLIHADGTATGLDGATSFSAVPFSLDITYNLDGAVRQFDSITPQDNELGGSGYGAPVIAFGVFHIDGTDRPFVGTLQSDALQQENVVQQRVQGDLGLPDVRIRALYSTSLFDADVFRPPSGNLCVGAFECEGGFSFGVDTVNGRLDLTNYTVTLIPEPEAWAMMLLGFVGIGTAIRRQRRPTFRII